MVEQCRRGRGYARRWKYADAEEADGSPGKYQWWSYTEDDAANSLGNGAGICRSRWQQVSDGDKGFAIANGYQGNGWWNNSSWSMAWKSDKGLYGGQVGENVKQTETHGCKVGGKRLAGHANICHPCGGRPIVHWKVKSCLGFRLRR